MYHREGADPATQTCTFNPLYSFFVYIQCLYGGERGIIRTLPVCSPYGPRFARSKSTILSILSNPLVYFLGFEPLYLAIFNHNIALTNTGILSVWRRERDSNPRYTISIHTLSRRAL